MITVRRFKRVAAVGLLVVAAVVGLLVLRQAGRAIVRSATGADPTSIFNDIPPAPAEVRSALHWLPDPERDGRPMEPRTRTAITDAYARALSAIDRAGRGDVDAALGDYLSGPALDAAVATARWAEGDAGGGAVGVDSVATIHVRQDLRLDFYSDDGSVVAVGVPEAELVRVVDAVDGRRSVVGTTEHWRFVMLLEDGNWRVQQIEAVDVEPRPEFGPRRALPVLPVGANALAAQGGDRTWASYDPEVAAADLDRLVELGLDSVRVFLAAPELGEIRLDSVTDFLDRAEARDVAVVLTLFDGAADHSVDEWADDGDYLDRVVGRLGDHPALMMWDLKNEPDLDDERSGGPQVVDAWIERTAIAVRQLDTDTPVTVGWSSAVQARRSVASVDVVSFHHFGTADDLRAALDDLGARIGDRQLVVSEFGRPAWLGFVRGEQSRSQALDVAAMLEVLDQADVGHLVWQLRDTDAPIEAGAVAGRASQSYGVYRADGSRRPLADVVVDGADAVAAAGLAERLRSLLPALALLLVLAGTAIGVWRWLFARRNMDGDGSVPGAGARRAHGDEPAVVDSASDRS